jgi:glycosyltransferase involved in cell wall biosynthesis
VIYNGIDVSKFRPMSLKKEQDAPTIVYVGRIERPKGVIVVIQSIKYVKEVIPNVRCLIYGRSYDAEYTEKCFKLINDLNLTDNVKFMGSTSEPEKAYNLADLVVNFSYIEGFPFSIIEAMACQKAIVATDVGGVKEALEGCGLILKSNSHPRQFAKMILNVLNDEKLRYDLGTSALKKVKATFTTEKIVEQYRQEYVSLIYNSKIRRNDNYDYDTQYVQSKYRMPIRIAPQ